MEAQKLHEVCPTRAYNYMPLPGEYLRAAELHSHPEMPDFDMHDRLVAEFSKKRPKLPRKPRERQGFRRLTAQELAQRAALRPQIVSGDDDEPDDCGDFDSEDGGGDETDDEDWSVAGPKQLKQATDQAALRHWRRSGWTHRLPYQASETGARQREEDGTYAAPIVRRQRENVNFVRRDGSSQWMRLSRTTMAAVLMTTDTTAIRTGLFSPGPSAPSKLQRRWLGSDLRPRRRQVAGLNFVAADDDGGGMFDAEEREFKQTAKRARMAEGW